MSCPKRPLAAVKDREQEKEGTPSEAGGSGGRGGVELEEGSEDSEGEDSEEYCEEDCEEEEEPPRQLKPTPLAAIAPPSVLPVLPVLPMPLGLPTTLVNPINPTRYRVGVVNPQAQAPGTGLTCNVHGPS